MPTLIKDDPAPGDEKYIASCLDLARQAAAAGEVPVGAVVVLDGAVIGAAHNQTRARQNALAHAEMLALAAAFEVAGEGRMPEARGGQWATWCRPSARMCDMASGCLDAPRPLRLWPWRRWPWALALLLLSSVW